MPRRSAPPRRRRDGAPRQTSIGAHFLDETVTALRALVSDARHVTAARVLFYFLVAASLLYGLRFLLTDPISLLLVSAESGSWLGARVALWRGADVWSSWTTSRDDGSLTRDTAVHIAAENGRSSVLRLLLRQRRQTLGGVHVLNARNNLMCWDTRIPGLATPIRGCEYLKTPLLAAPWKRHFGTAHVLTKFGADVNTWHVSSDQAFKVSLLHSIISIPGRSLDAVEFLVRRGAHIDRFSEGRLVAPPVFYAAKYNKSDVVAFLIAQGARLDFNVSYPELKLNYPFPTKTLTTDFSPAVMDALRATAVLPPNQRLQYRPPIVTDVGSSGSTRVHVTAVVFTLLALFAGGLCAMRVCRPRGAREAGAAPPSSGPATRGPERGAGQGHRRRPVAATATQRAVPVRSRRQLMPPPPPLHLLVLRNALVPKKVHAPLQHRRRNGRHLRRHGRRE